MASVNNHNQKKKLSGCQYRKIRKIRENTIKLDAGKLKQYFNVPPDPCYSEKESIMGIDSAMASANASLSVVCFTPLDINQPCSSSALTLNTKSAQPSLSYGSDSFEGHVLPIEIESAEIGSAQQFNSNNNFIVQIPTVETVTVGANFENNICFDDLGNWPLLNQNLIKSIVHKGPVQIKNYAFPLRNNRKFTPNQYERTMPNGEIVHRIWLVYSVSRDLIFCFCCKLFAKNKLEYLSHDGFGDWSHLGRHLKSHENSPNHIDAFKKWKCLEQDLKQNNTIDSVLLKNMNREVEHWREVLKRLLIFVQFLGTQSLAFRGTSEILYEQNNGNFLKLVESVSKFDLVLAEHLRRITNQETHIRYLSKNIQNELIAIISDSVREKIIKMVKEAKYYSIVVDTTPDKSRTEQVTLVIRFVHKKENDSFEIREHFLGFLIGTDTTGLGLKDIVLKDLADSGLLINNCRGQGYDNGANMKGKHSGMQARIRELEPRAFYVPCASHSTNLVVNDAASSTIEAISFFDTIQNIYVLFSGSTKRWDILKANIQNLTVKPLSTTRWSSRIDAVRPLKTQLGNIHEALLEISETSDMESRYIAESLGNKILEFKFICSLLVWYDILEKINIASKYLQNPQISIAAAVDILKTTKFFLENMRNDDKFESYINSGTIIATELDVVSDFPAPSTLRSRRKKRLFDYESRDEPIVNPKEKFKIDFYYRILDQALNSIKERFEQLNAHNEVFEFLYDIYELRRIVPDVIKTHCQNLQKTLTSNDGTADINGLDLYNELSMLPSLLNKYTSSIDVLNYIFKNNLETLFPSTVIALRILLTLPVTVASGERSFSKLKLIKNYLRTSMTQDRLVGLAILSIEKALVEDLEYDDLILNFARDKARKINFAN